MTNSDMPEELGRSLGRVEGKIDVLISSFASHAADDKVAFEIINKRLSSSETKINWIFGVGSGIMAILGLVYSFLRSKIG